MIGDLQLITTNQSVLFVLFLSCVANNKKRGSGGHSCSQHHDPVSCSQGGCLYNGFSCGPRIYEDEDFDSQDFDLDASPDDYDYEDEFYYDYDYDEEDKD